MDRPTRNRMVRWMNDHHIHYANARELAEACATALARAGARDLGAAPAELEALAHDYYPQDHRWARTRLGDQHRAWRPLAPHGRRPAPLLAGATRASAVLAARSMARQPMSRVRGTYIGSCNSTFLVYEKMQKALLHP